MAIQIIIGGQDYTSFVDLKSIKVESNIAVNSDTANFNILIPQKAMPRPKGGEEVKILNGTNIEFGGVVLTPKETAIATDRMLYEVKCRDYVYQFDKKVVVNTYLGATVGSIVKDIVANFTDGFTANNVLATDLSFAISRVPFDHVPPSKAIKKLADDLGFQWWIDYNKDVHFGPTMTVPSPLPNNTLLPDSDTANYSDLEFEEDVSQVRNQIYLLGYKLPASYTVTQTFQTDGQTNSFNTTYEPKHLLKDITVTLAGQKINKALDLVGGLPNNQLADGKVYINYKNSSYRFNQAPTAGQILSITYYPMFEMISMHNDPDAMSIMAQRDLTDGIYEYAVRDRQLTSIDASLAAIRGRLELYKYAYPHYTGQFYSFLQGWQPGQYFNLVSNNRMDGQFSSGTIFYVIKVEKEIVTHPLNGSPTFHYTVHISDTPYAT